VVADDPEPAERFTHELLDAHARLEAGRGIRGDVLHPAVAEAELAHRWPLEGEQHADQGRLAGPRTADEPDRLPAADREADPGEGRNGRSAAGQPAGRRPVSVAQAGHRSLLHHAPVLQHDGAVAEGGGHGQGVGDEQDGGPVLDAVAAENGDRAGLVHDVEGGRGLIGDQQPGLAGKSEGDPHPLTLPAGQLGRVAGQGPTRRARPPP